MARRSRWSTSACSASRAAACRLASREASTRVCARTFWTRANAARSSVGTCASSRIKASSSASCTNGVAASRGASSVRRSAAVSSGTSSRAEASAAAQAPHATVAPGGWVWSCWRNVRSTSAVARGAGVGAGCGAGSWAWHQGAAVATSKRVRATWCGQRWFMDGRAGHAPCRRGVATAYRGTAVPGLASPPHAFGGRHHDLRRLRPVGRRRRCATARPRRGCRSPGSSPASPAKHPARTAAGRGTPDCSAARCRTSPGWWWPPA